MSLLEHPETRESLKRFTWEQLAKDIHVEIFGKESNDSIDRRLQQKIAKELQKRYDAGTIKLNGIDKKEESDTPLIDALLSDEPEADNTELDTEPAEAAEPEVEAAQPEVEEVPELPSEPEPEEPVNAALAWATGDPVPPPPPKPEKPAKTKKAKAPKGEPKSRRQGLDEELDYRGLSRPCKKCGKEGMHKCCPQCDVSAKGIEGVEEIFGFRPTKAKKGDKAKIRIIQTWCRGCRRKSSGASKKAAQEKKQDTKESSPSQED
jgi:hypothetical protein